MGLSLVSGGSDPGGSPLRMVDRWHASAPDGLSAVEERQYAAARLREQVEAGATLLVTPAHEPGGPDSPSRGLDLRLARATVAAAHALGLDARGFTVYAGVHVVPRTLVDPLDRAMLVRLYADLHVDGYVVLIAGLSESSPVEDIDAACEFSGALGDASGRPVVLAGGGSLAGAMVAEGLASAVVGDAPPAQTFLRVTDVAARLRRREARRLLG